MGEITAVDKKLITNFSIILRTLSSGRNINIPNFEKLLKETTVLYFNLYPWYYMPTTVHKILIHGIDCIKYSNIPIGMLSEEAVESCHKILRNVRLKHTRKRSRIDSNKDLIMYMILQSEPSISMYSKKKLLNNYLLSDLKEYIIKNEHITPTNELTDESESGNDYE